jgi:hypothetical protein
MVALDLDAILIDSAARSTPLFELGGKCLKFLHCKAEPRDDGNTFASTSLCLAADSNDAVPHFAGAAVAADAFACGAQAIWAASADVRRIDNTIFARHRYALGATLCNFALDSRSQSAYVAAAPRATSSV